MSDARSSAIQYAHEHRESFLEDLKTFVRIPSISTSPEHAADMQSAAVWVADELKRIGFERVEIFQTALHPIVYGEHRIASSSAPTVLVYGHYDVQPVEPLDLWQSGPFEPTVRGDNLFGRGASDMKGQIVASIKAIESILQHSQPAANIKFIVEGEEEIGSPHLSSFLKEHKDMLACDFALNADTGMIAADVPTITYGLRGLAYFELRVYGPEHDLHSGLFGGVVHNPAQALCELIAGMHDADGRITLPGFYDSVRPLSDDERAELSRLPLNRESYLAQTGAPEIWGEKGYTPVERVGGRPTLEVNGMLSGFTGAGSKTVIPAWAMAKISMRLVPDQNPADVKRQLTDYLEACAPNTIRWEVKVMSGGPASISDRNLPATQAMYKAQESVWGIKPVYRREGGSVPVVADMQRILGVESVLTGFGLPDDNIHAPNEKLHLPTWYRGIDALIHFFHNIGNL